MADFIEQAIQLSNAQVIRCNTVIVFAESMEVRQLRKVWGEGGKEMVRG